MCAAAGKVWTGEGRPGAGFGVMSDAAWVGFGVAILVAGFLRGFTGFGFSMTAVPLLSLVVAPAEAIPVAVLLQAAISVAGLREAVAVAERRSVGLMAAGAAAGTPAGVAVLARLEANQARVAIAALMLGAIVLLGRGWRLRRALPGAGLVGVGVAAGVANGLVGVPGPPIVAYYVASGTAAGVARGSMILFFLVASVFAAVSLAWAGLLHASVAGPALVGVPLVFAGSWAGTVAFRRSGGRHFERVALAVLAATACATLGRALPGF